MTKQQDSSSILTLAFGVIFFISSSTVNAQITWGFDQLDGSAPAPHNLNTGNSLAYAAVPLSVDSKLALSSEFRYSIGFTTSPNPSNMAHDVSEMDTPLDILLFAETEGQTAQSAAEEAAVTGTVRIPTFFDMRFVNNVQIADAVIPSGNSHIFEPEADGVDFGSSLANTPMYEAFYDLSEDAIVTLADSSTVMLGDFLSSQIGTEIYIASSLNQNITTSGAFSIGVNENIVALGPGPTILRQGNGFVADSRPAAHSLTAIAATVLGDINLDQVVSFLDIAPFITLLSGGIFQDEADINRDGQVTFLDISPFIAILSGQ